MTCHVVNVTYDMLRMACSVVKVKYDMLMMFYVGSRPSCVQSERPESYEACAAPQILAAPVPVHPHARESHVRHSCCSSLVFPVSC